MCSKRREFFFGCSFFFLEAVGAKWGRQLRGRKLESKLKRLDGKDKLIKENAAASSEPIGTLRYDRKAKTGTTLDGGNFRGSRRVTKNKMLKMCIFAKDGDPSFNP